VVLQKHHEAFLCEQVEAQKKAWELIGELQCG
jgi:hypothetical protein